MVNKHGDPKSPKDRIVPLIIGLFMAYKWGVTNYLLTGMILQVDKNVVVNPIGFHHHSG